MEDDPCTDVFPILALGGDKWSVIKSARCGELWLLGMK